jgi:hypothetical protein
MIIANPLYDVIFKYLLEDIDIAKELLATILGEEILYLEVKPQETATNLRPTISINWILQAIQMNRLFKKCSIVCKERLLTMI